MNKLLAIFLIVASVSALNPNDSEFKTFEEAYTLNQYFKEIDINNVIRDITTVNKNIDIDNIFDKLDFEDEKKYFDRVVINILIGQHNHFNLQ